MGRFPCDCGEVINIGLMPNPDGVFLILDVDFESVGDRVVEAHDFGVSDYEMLRANRRAQGKRPGRAFRQAYICPRCSRLHLMDPNEAPVMTTWTFQSGNPHPFHPPRNLADHKGVWRMPRTETA